MFLQLKNFLLHLRLHYQFFILSGPFLIGGVSSHGHSHGQFLLQFFSIHIFLFGGVTVYNSYWDKDEGPIGGLTKPPEMKKWMLIASWFFQLVGFCIAVLSGAPFSALYVVSLLFFWLYSSPKTRWKGHPLLSLFAIGISTGIAPYFMGYLSSGGIIISLSSILLSVGVALCLISLYPLSQIYQVSEDKKRGDVTFVVKYGKKGIMALFATLFPLGSALSSLGLHFQNNLLAISFLMGSICIGILVWKTIIGMSLAVSSYEVVMKLKYISGGTFSLFCISVLICKYLNLL